MAFPHDYEARHFVRELQQQVREVERGQRAIKDADLLPRGSRLENGRVVMPGDSFILGVGLLIYVPIIALLTYWLFAYLARLSLEQYQHPTLMSYVVVPVASLALGITFYYVRERLNLISYAVIEIGVGMATAAQFASNFESGPLARIIALLAGLRIIVDGVARLVKFQALKKERSDANR